MDVKETLQILLDHGSEFINTGYELPFNSFLPELLESQRWTVESIRLLIRRGAEPGLYVPPWDSCLHLAILGSGYESPEGLRDALILLIVNGADVYAKDRSGHSVTDIAYNAGTKWWYDRRWHLNGDWTLRGIWTEALAACGYDAEEVVSRTLRVAELPDSDSDMDEDEDDHDISEDEDDDNTSEDEANDNTHQDDENITQSQGQELSLDRPNNSAICETCSFTKESTDDESRRQTDSAVHGHFDWSSLEDDTNVWRT